MTEMQENALANPLATADAFDLSFRRDIDLWSIILTVNK